MKLRYNTKVNVPNLCHIQHKMHNGIYIFDVDEENIRDKRNNNLLCHCVRFGIVPSLIRETEYLAVLNELCHDAEDGFLFRS